MKLKVNLYTILKKYGKGKIGADRSVDLPDDTRVSDLLEFLAIPEKMGKIILVNGLPKDKEHGLGEGDEVKILSFIGGG